MAFETVRTTVGVKLIEYGVATQDVAPEFSNGWDPNRQSGLGRAAEVAGQLMESTGRKILPEVTEDN
jgi:hypothetical protein